MTSSRYWICTGLDENGDELSFVIEYPEDIELENGELYSLCLVKGLCYCFVFTAIEYSKNLNDIPEANTNNITDIVNYGRISELDGTIIRPNQTNNFNLPVKSDVCKDIQGKITDDNYLLIRNYCKGYQEYEYKISIDSRTDDQSTLEIDDLYYFTFGNPERDGIYVVVESGFAEENVLENELVRPTHITHAEEPEGCLNHKFRRCDGGKDIVSADIDFKDEHGSITPRINFFYHINWKDSDGNDIIICVEYLGQVNETANVAIVQCAEDPLIRFKDCGCNSTSETLEFEDCITGLHYYWPQSLFISASDFTEGVSYTLGIYTKKCYTYIGVSDHEPNNPYIMNKANEKLCIDCDTYFRLYDVYSCYDNEKFDVPVIISGQILTELESLHNSSLTFEYNGVEYKCVTYGNYVQIDEDEYEELTSGEHILIDDSVTTYKDCKECIDSIVDEGNEGVWTITGCDGETNILVIGTAEYESYDGCTVLFSVDGKAPKCGTINSVDITSSIPGYENVSASRIDIEGSYKNCQKCHDDNCNKEEEKNEVLGFTPDNNYSVNATYDSCIKYDVCCEDKNKDL